jgi:hypothetical protein
MVRLLDILFILVIIYLLVRTIRGPRRTPLPGRPRQVECVVIDKKSQKYLDDRRRILEGIQAGSLGVDEAEKRLDDLDRKG